MYLKVKLVVIMQKIPWKQVAWEILMNFSTPFILTRIFGLDLVQSSLLILGTFLVDSDHLLFYVVKFKKFSGMVDFFSVNFKNHNPSFFIFHTFEFLTISLLLSIYFKSILFYLFIGFTLNVFLDILTYLFFYKSTHPWLNYLIATKYFRKNKVKLNKLAVKDL